MSDAIANTPPPPYYAAFKTRIAKVERDYSL